MWLYSIYQDKAIRFGVAIGLTFMGLWIYQFDLLLKHKIDDGTAIHLAFAFSGLEMLLMFLLYEFGKALLEWHKSIKERVR